MTAQSARPALANSALGRAYASRRVLVTGHTGFKGSWLCEWLLALDAQVTGFSLSPDTSPALFSQLGLAERLDHRTGDIRDVASMMEIVDQVQPDFVFHLAAQPLVRRAYREPLLTYQANVLGTVHLLEALRPLQKPCAAVFVTSDKAYENKEWVFGYREDDALGGFDPYSSSKGAAEIAIAAWRRSFFSAHPVRIASARAGNVIGGGDWSEDRIVPDCIRALRQSLRVPVRNLRSTRHWQHVLEPLSGYLWLAAALHEPALATSPPEKLASAFNFGPSPNSNRPVVELVQEVLKHWAGDWDDRSDPNAVHEAGLLQLCTDKAHALLAWQPVWEFAETVQHTVGWYRAAEPLRKAKDFHELTRSQIETYCQAAARLQIAWAKA